MSEKTPLIGLICTFIGVVLSIFVYVDTSSKIIDPVDELKGNDIYLDDPWAGSKVKSFKNISYHLMLLIVTICINFLILKLNPIFPLPHWEI